MEVAKVMQVSARHIKPSTMILLAESSINGLVVYPKEEYGFFVVANTDDVCLCDVPSELAYLLGVAESQGHYYLELDHDFPVSDKLQVFEEDEDCDCL